MRKDAVTLIELLIVIVIIGILAAIAVPIYTGKVERTKGERAIANIEMIASAMKMYQVKNDNLYSCTSGYYADFFPTTDGVYSNITTINHDLNLDLSDDNFYYNVNKDGNYYEILVTRISNNYKLMYSINPSLNKEGWNPTDCPNPDWPWFPTHPAYI